MPTQEGPVSAIERARRRTQASYDRLSRWYDRVAGRGEWRFVVAGLRMLDVRAGEHVLEIGCGTGRALAHLRRAATGAGIVCGVDLSARMLARAQATLQRAGSAEWGQLVLGDGARPPFTAGAFDAAFMSFTLELFAAPELPLVLAECRRVLRAGGRLCVVAMALAHRPGLMTRLYEWAHKTFPATVDCRPIRTRDLLEAAGFCVRQATEIAMWGLPVDIVLAER